MKKMNLMIAGLVLVAGVTACNDSGTSTKTTTDNTTVSTDSGNAITPPPATTTTVNKMPFNKDDSMFVMKAATGGLMEVEAANIALQNAASDRVKAFATMMVNDHSKANSELTALATGRNVSLPSTLPEDMQKHMEAMRKMTGKSFDKHYVDMMMKDHKEDLALFEKQASSGADSELKAWAAKTVPVLQVHRDSVMALSKMK